MVGFEGPYAEETMKVIENNWSAIKTYHIKRKTSRIYNIIIRDSNIVQTLKNFDTTSILNDQINKFKVNASVGSVLLNNTDQTMRYFHATLGEDRLFHHPKVIESQIDFKQFLEEVCSEDMIKFVTRNRPDSAWSLHVLTNLTFYVFPIPNHAIGHPDGIINYVKNSKAIVSAYADKNGKAYTDNLCLFRALSYFFC